MSWSPEYTVFLKNFLDQLAGLFIIASPFGAVPIFLQLTNKHTEMRDKIAFRTAVAFAVTLFITMICGEWIVRKFFGGIGPLRIAGGLYLIFCLGKDMVEGKTVKVDDSLGGTSQVTHLLSQAVAPLAVPILVGPGAISTTISLAEQGGRASLAIVIVLLSVFVYGIFHVAGRFSGRGPFGVTGTMILMRIMGLLTMALGCSMVVQGARDAGILLPK